MAGRDPAWAHGKRYEGGNNGSVCNYCDVVIKSGGVSRLKYHLAGTDKNTKPCRKVPAEVKQWVREQLLSNEKGKMAKRARTEDIRSELRGDAYEDDEDIYDQDMDKQERAQFRQACIESRQTATQSRGGAGGSGTRPNPTNPALYKPAGGRQRNIRDSLSGGSVQGDQNTLIARHFIYDDVPPEKANSHHFKNMVVGCQRAGVGVPPPSPYEIRTKYLDREFKEMTEHVTSMKQKWAEYGCTIMSDGWTGPTKLSIINFMVYSKGSTIFLKSIDASGRIKDSDYIFSMLQDVVREVGKSNVVQVVTDNGSNFKKAGKMLMAKYPLFWTPCAAHCIDLIFQDIGKRERIASIIKQARSITNFIYNHGQVLSQMREICGGDIVRPGATRFATNFIAMESLKKKRSGLRNLFTSNEWENNRLSRNKEGRRVYDLVINHGFWENVGRVCHIYEPLYKFLRVVDAEVTPTMGSVYALMREMLNSIKDQRSTEWLKKIVENRWDNTLSHSLHAAAYYFNPKYQYKVGVGDDIDLLAAVHKVYTVLDPKSKGVAHFGNEIIYFRDARRSFGQRAAVASRETMSPTEWWVMYGTDAPTLRRLAIRVLSQTASSSACERNWSTFALIHTKQRNKLSYKRLEKLVFCYYNMKLKIRDMEAACDKINEMDPLDLLQISAELNEEEDTIDPLFKWIRPAHLDDNMDEPHPEISSHARELGIDVDQVMVEEVRSSDSDEMVPEGTTSESSGNDGNDPSENGSDDDNGSDDGNGSDDDNASDDGNGGDDGQGDMHGGEEFPDFTMTPQYSAFSNEEDLARASRGVEKRGKQNSENRWKNTSQEDVDSISDSLGSMSISTQNTGGSAPMYTESWDTYFSHCPERFSPLNNPYYEFCAPIGFLGGATKEQYEQHVLNFVTNMQHYMTWHQYVAWIEQGNGPQ